MTRSRRHLVAATALAALALLCFALLIWALGEGAVVANFPGDVRVRSKTAGHEYQTANTVYTREEAPGRYWLIVGLLGSFGTLFAIVAVLERNAYRVTSNVRAGRTPIPDVLAKIDRIGRLHPESRDTLVRAKATLLDVHDPVVATSLDHLLAVILAAPERTAAQKEIQNLMKALHVAGEL